MAHGKAYLATSEAESRGGRDSTTGASSRRSLQGGDVLQGAEQGLTDAVEDRYACQMPAFGGIHWEECVCKCVDMCVYTWRVCFRAKSSLGRL